MLNKNFDGHAVLFAVAELLVMICMPSFTP